MTRKPQITRVQELVYELKIGDVMTRDVSTVTPDTLMSGLRGVLRDKRISGVPVVDGDELVGIISIEDIIKWLIDGEENCHISDKMSREVSTLYADEPLVTAVNMFDKFGFGRFPVVGREKGELMGILTKGDIVEGLLKRLEIDYHEEEIHRYRASHIFEDMVADKIRLTLRYYVVGQDFKRAGGSASGLKKTLTRLNIHPRIVRRAGIATYEAEMNITVFAEKGEIAVEIEPDQIRVEANDSGPGIPDVEKAMRIGYSTAPDWVRELGFGAGMGLNNIKKCADEMDLTSRVGRGTRLRIIIRTQNESKIEPADYPDVKSA